MHRDDYSPAVYLQAVGGWRQRKRLAQLRTRLHCLPVETRRFGPRVVIRQERLCERCTANAVGDEEHMLIDCAALEQQRRQHPSLCVRSAMRTWLILWNKVQKRWQPLFMVVTRPVRNDFRVGIVFVGS